MSSAIMAPTRIPNVSQPNLAVISVTGWPKCSDMAPEMMPIGASIPDMTK